MKIDQNVRVGVISSIAATILFLYFLNPIFTFIGRVIFRLGGTLYATYIDKLFAQAALATTTVEFTMYSILSSFVAVGCIIGALEFWQLARRIDATLDPKDDEAKPDLPPPSTRRLRVLSAVAVVMAVLIFWFEWNAWFQLRIITSFNQHLTIVQPYISQQEAAMLRSRFARMRNEQDYRAI